MKRIRDELDGTVTFLKKGQYGLEQNLVFFWWIFDNTIGDVFARIREEKSLFVMLNSLSSDERDRWFQDLVWRKKKIAKLRTNFGRGLPELFQIESVFLNRSNPLMMEFCKKVGNAEALDIVYNALLSFFLNEKVFTPEHSMPKFLDRFHFSCPNGQSVRNRYRIVKEIYKTWIPRCTLSIACGSAQALIHGLAEFFSEDEREDMVLCLSDESENAINIARKKANFLGVSSKVEFIKSAHGHLFNFVGSRKFNCVEACGILDYLPDRYAIQLIRFAFSILESNGILILSNMSETRGAVWLRKVYNWEIIYRTYDEFIALIEKAGGKKITVFIEPWGIHPVALVRNA